MTLDRARELERSALAAGLVTQLRAFVDQASLTVEILPHAKSDAEPLAVLLDWAREVEVDIRRQPGGSSYTVWERS